MKAELSILAVFQVALQTDAHTAESQVLPRNILCAEERNLETFLAGCEIRGDHAAAIKKMYLVDVSDADHGEWRIDRYPRPGFFQRFPTGCLGGCFAVLHESGRQRPEAESRLDRPATKQNALVPLGNAANDEAGIFILDVAAVVADMSGEGVAGRNDEGNISAAVVAVTDHNIYWGGRWIRLQFNTRQPRRFVARLRSGGISFFALGCCLWLQ